MKPYYEKDCGKLYHGNVLDVLKTMPDQSVNCCVTSPPYWWLRDYGVEGQIGMESTPEKFVETMVMVFREVRRVLSDDGTCWINLGDTYAAARSYQVADNKHQVVGAQRNLRNAKPPAGWKQKDLIGIPWMVAFALQADGWYLRSAMPWVKRTAMPESVKDRPSAALEYVFMMTKSQKYYCDMESIKVAASQDTHARYARGRSNDHKYADGGPGKQTIGKTFKHMVREPGVTPKSARPGSGVKANESFHQATSDIVGKRNLRNTDLFFQSIEKPFGMIAYGDEFVGIDVTPKGSSAAHYATFPVKFAEPFIIAGCPRGGAVLDPFMGTGTTAVAAHDNGRTFVGIELNQKDLDEIAIPRIEAATAQLKLFA